MGVALGDGNLSNPNGRATRLRVTCDARYPHLARRIARSIHTLLPRNRVPFVRKKSACLDVSCYSNHWERLLGWQVGLGSKITQRVGVPSWILEDRAYVVPCLRGLIETDGSLYVDRGYTTVMFASACASLAEDVGCMMTSLGFAPRSYVIETDRRRPIHHVRLSRDVAAFVRLVRPRKS